MYPNLLKHIASADESDLTSLSPETLSLCQFTLDQAGDDGETPVDDTQFADIVARWMELISDAGRDLSHDRLAQPLLRPLIDELQQSGPQGFLWDEAAFLVSTARFCERAAKLSLCRDIGERIAAHMDRLREIGAGSEAKSLREGLPHRGHFVTAKEIAAAPRRDIQRFAGLEIDFRGPVYQESGSVKIVGTVPEEVMVVNDTGSCIIEGYLEGKVAARDDCIVQETIAGMAVVRRGDVRTRGIIDRATVISKRGTVRCDSMGNPTLVFAGNTVEVYGKAVMGRITTAHARIEGEAFGGVYQVTHSLKGELFRVSDTRPMAIVLRDSISCEDYGESMSREARAKLSRTRRLQQDIDVHEDRSRALESEVEEAAHTLLLYLAGKDDNRNQVDELNRAQRRVASLNRTILAIYGLAEKVERNIYNAAAAETGSDKPSKLLSDIAHDGDDESDRPSPTDADFHAMASEIARQLFVLADPKKAIATSPAKLGRARQVLSDAYKRLELWNQERRAARETAERIRHELDSATTAQQETLGIRPEGSDMENLHAVLTFAKAGKLSDDIRQRITSPFASVIIRTIKARRASAREHREASFELHKELAALVDELRRVHNVDLQQDHGAEMRRPHVTGRFEAGIRILTEPYLLSEPEPPQGSIIITKASGQEPRTYARDLGVITEEK